MPAGAGVGAGGTDGGVGDGTGGGGAGGLGGVLGAELDTGFGAWVTDDAMEPPVPPQPMIANIEIKTENERK